MASTEEMMGQVLSPDEHLARAQRYANTLPAILSVSSETGVMNNQANIALMDVYLHAAEVHLALRTAMLEPRVTMEKTWDTAVLPGHFGPTKREQA